MIAQVNGSVDWLPPDEAPQAACAWTDAQVWALALGLVVVVFVVGPLVSSAMPLRAVGLVVGLITALYLWRVIRARVTVSTDGVGIRGNDLSM